MKKSTNESDICAMRVEGEGAMWSIFDQSVCHKWHNAMQLNPLFYHLDTSIILPPLTRKVALYNLHAVVQLSGLHLHKILHITNTEGEGGGGFCHLAVPS